MASYREASEIVTPVPRLKLIPGNFQAADGRVDQGRGLVRMEVVGVVVDEEGTPIVDAEGKEQVLSLGRSHSIPVQDTLSKTFSGITGAQVLDYIGQLFDELEGVAE